MPGFDAVNIELAGEPIAWARTRISKSGVLFNPTKQRNTAAAFKIVAMAAMQGRPPFDCPVAVSFFAYFPVPASWSGKKQKAALAGNIWPTRRPDLSNLVKLFEDACNGIVFRDDALIVSYLWLKKAYGPSPHISVTVQPI